MIKKALLLAAVACAVPALCVSQETKAPAKQAAAPAAAIDVLDRPAQMTPLAARRLMQSVARAGDRLVAVGPRGHIVVSTDGGATWKQANVPVSSDLTAVYFVNDKSGWAVGHDGVVLATTDGGDDLDQATRRSRGERARCSRISRRKLAAADPDSAELKALPREAERFVEQGPDKPFLDVWFQDEKTGYVVGAYNLIFATTDGGKTWEPWFDRTENPKFLNLYSIRPAAGGLYIAGEGRDSCCARSARRSASAPCRWTTRAACSAWSTPATPCFDLRPARATCSAATTAARPGPRSTASCTATIVGGVRTSARARSSWPTRAGTHRTQHRRRQDVQAGQACPRRYRSRHRSNAGGGKLGL